MNNSNIPSIAIAAIETATGAAYRLLEIAGEADDAFIAQEIRLTGHALAYRCWLIGNRQKVLEAHNWKTIAIREFPSASEEEFMDGFSLQEHLHALGRYIDDPGTSPDTAPGFAR